MVRGNDASSHYSFGLLDGRPKTEDRSTCQSNTMHVFNIYWLQVWKR